MGAILLSVGNRGNGPALQVWRGAQGAGRKSMDDWREMFAYISGGRWKIPLDESDRPSRPPKKISQRRLRPTYAYYTIFLFVRIKSILWGAFEIRVRWCENPDDPHEADTWNHSQRPVVFWTLPARIV